MISVRMSGALTLYCCAVAAVLGAAFGSFLNCVAWRLAHGEPWWKGRSHCPACGRTLAPPDLVPVFSWLFLRGRCRYCKAKIPVRYLLSELFFALVTVLCLLRFDLTLLCLRNWVLLCGLFCLALVDLEIYEIPDGCLLLPALVWAAAAPFLGLARPGWRESLLAGVVFGGGLLLVSLALDRLLGRESLGGGDIKLFALLGLYLGFIGTLFTLILACVLGLLLGLVRREEGGRIPFGPAIALAGGGMLLYGGALIDWYLALLSV